MDFLFWTSRADALAGYTGRRQGSGRAGSPAVRDAAMEKSVAGTGLKKSQRSGKVVCR